MYIKEAHIKIEQGLHNVGVFAYYDMLPEEIDLKLNDWLWKTLENDFKPNGVADFSVTQASLDKYQTLIEKQIELVGSQVEDEYVVTLPDNYYHRIKDSSIILYECSLKHIVTGKIAKDTWYKIKEGSITYSGTTYTKGQLFRGIDGIAGYVEPTPTECTKVIKLERQLFPNRLTEETKIDALNNNALYKTRYSSPLSTLASNKIFVKVLGFYVEKVYISYLRKPIKVNSQFKQYVAGNILEVGKDYEVISEQVLYNGNQYHSNTAFQFDSFTVLAGAQTFTGTGKVRLKGDGDLELPTQTAIEIIDKVILDIAATTEQPQQKVNNLAQINNVSS